MIVVDASAVVEVLLGTPAAAAIERRLFDAGETLHAPHLLESKWHTRSAAMRRAVRSMTLAAEWRWLISMTFLCTGIRTTLCYCASGICETTSQPTTPPTSPWRKNSARH